MALYYEGGNLEILGSLYQRYMDLVYGLCLRYLEDPEAARDAVMQIFEELITKLRRHEVTHFKSWLYSVARNHCLMSLRSQPKGKVVALPEEFMQSEAPAHLNGSIQKETELVLLEKCIDSLHTEQQKTVKLFYLEQRSYNEIAELTGIDWNRVRSLIQNGRRNLKICMEKTMDGKTV